MKLMWEQYIIIYACQSDADRFRQELDKLEVKAVFRRYRDRLQQIYKQFSGSKGFMDSADFVRLARDRGLIQPGLTESNVKNVFNRIQDDEGALLAAAGALDLGTQTKGSNSAAAKPKAQLRLDLELSFPEMLEGLGALAVYKDPDPYLPMHQKLDNFLRNSICVGK